MLTNYFIIALRNLRRQKLYTLITVIGLAVGMAVCLLIFVFVRHEWTFDHVHANADRIFRVIQHEKAMTRSAHSFAETPIPLAPTLKETYPEVEQYCRVLANTTLVQVQNKSFSERVHLADPSIFSMFTLPLRHGNPSEALSKPENVVLSVSMAKKLFGSSEAVGKRLSVQVRDGMKEYLVAGIAEDVPANSSVRFDILASFENTKTLFNPRAQTAWGIIIPETYLLLSEKATPAALEQKFTSAALLFYNNVFEKDLVQLFLQPLKDIHLNTAIEGGIEQKGNRATSFVLACVAVLILIIACSNFVIISLGRSVRRANEVGIRKVFGALSGQVRLQFVLEATLLTLISLVLGIVLAELLLPSFNALAILHLSFHYDAMTLGVILLLALFVGCVAGSYPAFVLSILQPSAILKGTTKFIGSGRLRSGLIVGQFAISIVLIVFTLVMMQQLRYMQTKHPGFSKEQVVLIKTGLRPQEASGVYENFRNAVQQRSDVLGVAGSATTVGGEFAKVGFTADNTVYHEFYATTVDENYLPTMGIQLVSGRNFQRDVSTDRFEALIVNEAFVKHFGWQNPLEQKLPSKQFPQHRIIGVMQDFHFQSLHNAIAPMALVIRVDSIGRGIENVDGGSLRGINVIALRLAPGNIPASLAAVEQIWKQVAPSKPFDYSFLDKNLEEQYRNEERTSKLAVIAAFLAITIACMGLFSLAALVTEQRVKEIGIRKVLGASVASIITLLSKDFLKLVAIGFVLAVPLAYWSAGKWLQDFAYRIEVSWWLLASAGVMAIAIAFMTVASQAWSAARANPIQSIKYE